jgi:hypothetical protein
MSDFVPGLELSEAFYSDLVGPLLASHFPAVPYAAALIGSGSEVLGFDTAISSDHHWGPRLLLFLSEEDYPRYKTPIEDMLSRELPYTFRGYSTNFGGADTLGVRLLTEIESGPVSHRVEVYTVYSFLGKYLGVDVRAELRAADWLTISEHRLLAVTFGKVFHDGLGDLSEARERLRYFPRDVWLYMLASQWTKIAQEEAFVGRAGDVGDELGSRVIAARLVQYLMRLCFLMERKYAPYPKWFGTGFSRLDAAPLLTPVFHEVLSALTWRERERHLSEAYRIAAHMHNALGITPPLEADVSSYYDRPYMVIHAGSFAGAIHSAITSDEVKRIGLPIGSANQFIDSTDFTEDLDLMRKLRTLYS